MQVCNGDDHEYRLIRDLLRNYDPRLRPLKNASHALNVTFGLALSQIIDVVSILHCAPAAAQYVYCNRSCLSVSVWLCLWVCYHDNSK